MSLPPDLVAWLEATLGGRVTGCRPLTSGNSRVTWAVDAAARERSEVVVRIDTGDGPFSDTILSLGREAQIYAALSGTGVSIPEFYGYDPELEALALARVPGSPEWGPEVLVELLGELRQLHNLDPQALDLPPGRTAREELDLWESVARARIDPGSQFVDFAFERLRALFPGEPERAVTLHGDPGIGNLLWEDGKITALLDWEMAHVGDPYDDLAYITVRTALHMEPLEDFSNSVRRGYFGDSEAPLDRERLHYWQAMAVLRNVIICESAVRNPLPGRDHAIQRILLPSINRLLIGTLARLEGIELPPPVEYPEAPSLPGAETISQVADELADLAGLIDDPDANQRARRLRFLLSQFAATWGLAPRLAEEEAAEGPFPTDPADRLRRLARVADRQVALFPRAARMARAMPADF